MSWDEGGCLYTIPGVCGGGGQHLVPHAHAHSQISCPAEGLSVLLAVNVAVVLEGCTGTGRTTPSVDVTVTTTPAPGCAPLPHSMVAASRCSTIEWLKMSGANCSPCGGGGDGSGSGPSPSTTTATAAATEALAQSARMVKSSTER